MPPLVTLGKRCYQEVAFSHPEERHGKPDLRIPNQWLLMSNHPERISKALISDRNHDCNSRILGMGSALIYKVSQPCLISATLSPSLEAWSQGVHGFCFFWYFFSWHVDACFVLVVIFLFAPMSWVPLVKTVVIEQEPLLWSCFFFLKNECPNKIIFWGSGIRTSIYRVFFLLNRIQILRKAIQPVI